MSGHIGLREDARIGHHLAKQIAMLFVGWVEPQAKPNGPAQPTQTGGWVASIDGR